MALDKAMIAPFEERQVRKGVISYGLSSYGYDIRISDEFKIFTNIHTTIVDPKSFDPRCFVGFSRAPWGSRARCPPPPPPRLSPPPVWCVLGPRGRLPPRPPAPAGRTAPPAALKTPRRGADR